MMKACADQLAPLKVADPRFLETRLEDTQAAMNAIDPLRERERKGDFPISAGTLARLGKRRPADAVLRALDILFSGALIILLAPLLAVVALLIRFTSPGPALFKQERHGLFGRRFLIFKFRSMSNGPVPPQGVQTSRNDPRITWIGKFLRATSIDELPQLLNVLRGDMSLVGPRPLPIQLDYDVAPELPYYAQRFMVRPGITGLAQSRGHRGPILGHDALRRRTLLDIVYVRRRSVRLYLATLISTAALFLFHSDAF
jgi:putative colanic acid biosynthesis UDP-glucose lipid carrier transferase